MTWLPNQLDSVLKIMIEVGEKIPLNSLSNEDQRFFEIIKKRVDYEVVDL